MKREGKRYLLLFLLLVMAFAVGGCNFFGKKEAEVLSSIPGKLDDGSSILGTWTTISANSSATNNPTVATSTTYFFDPTGNVRIEVRDYHTLSLTCVAYGVLRNVGKRSAMIYIQLTNSAMCGFGTQIEMDEISTNGYTFSYREGASGPTKTFFTTNTPKTAPVGVWDFASAGADAHGEGGIDYLFLDNYGYFYLQTTVDAKQELLIGFYQISNGALVLNFFKDNDPNAVYSGMVFTQFITDGTTLILTDTLSDGTEINYSGTRK